MLVISLKLLLTMCLNCLATSPSDLTVIQTPTKINILTGDYTEITCFWVKATIMRYRVSWYLVNKANISETVSSKLVHVSKTTREDKDVLVIKSAKVNSTGFYYCEIIIEIPFYMKLRGKGTTVIVEEKVAEADSLERTDLVMWAIVPFLVAVGSLYLCYRKKQHSTLPGRHEEEQMLEVVELHEINESTREAAEENSSRNSAEWAESTLYESLEFLCNESRGKDDKSTSSIVSSAGDEQIPQTRAAEKSRMRQGSAMYFDIQN